MLIRSLAKKQHYGYDTFLILISVLLVSIFSALIFCYIVLSSQRIFSIFYEWFYLPFFFIIFIVMLFFIFSNKIVIQHYLNIVIAIYSSGILMFLCAILYTVVGILQSVFSFFYYFF